MINKRIITLREKRGLTQRELAKRVNINISVMNRIESGERPVRDDEIIKIAEALRVTTDYLLGLSDILNIQDNQGQTLPIFDRIEELALKKGFSLIEIEKECEFMPGDLEKWKNSIPTADRLQKVSRVLGTTSDYLLNGEDSNSDRTKLLAREAENLTEEQLMLIKKMIMEMKKNQR